MLQWSPFPTFLNSITMKTVFAPLAAVFFAVGAFAVTPLVVDTP